jgi:hypothetical protein
MPGPKPDLHELVSLRNNDIPVGEPCYVRQYQLTTSYEHATGVQDGFLAESSCATNRQPIFALPSVVHAACLHEPVKIWIPMSPGLEAHLEGPGFAMSETVHPSYNRTQYGLVMV